MPLGRAERIVELRRFVLRNNSELKEKVGEELGMKVSALTMPQNVGETNVY